MTSVFQASVLLLIMNFVIKLLGCVARRCKQFVKQFEHDRTKRQSSEEFFQAHDNCFIVSWVYNCDDQSFLYINFGNNPGSHLGIIQLIVN